MPSVSQLQALRTEQHAEKAVAFACICGKSEDMS